MAIDPRDLRHCLGDFATGVTVVTCHTDDGGQHGATVNAFTAVSLDPPLVLVSLDRTSRCARLLDGRPFTVNVLRGWRQQDLALHFAGRPNSTTSSGTPTAPAERRGSAGALAPISCTPWRTTTAATTCSSSGEVQQFLGSTTATRCSSTPDRFHHLGGDHDPLPVGRLRRRHRAAVAWFSRTAVAARPPDTPRRPDLPTDPSPILKEGVER